MLMRSRIICWQMKYCHLNTYNRHVLVNSNLIIKKNKTLLRQDCSECALRGLLFFTWDILSILQSFGCFGIINHRALQTLCYHF